MSITDKFHIVLNGNPLFIVIGSLALIIYTWYIYKFTIPQISSFLKYVLIFIRSIVITLILFLIFEPQLTINNSEKIEPVNYLFIDNSSSMAIKDSADRIGLIKIFQNDFNTKITTAKKEFLFGINPKEFNDIDSSKLNFSEPLTNFSRIFEFAKKNKNVGSITIISDGIITDGYEPLYDAEKLGVPVFTIGIGDTSVIKDLLIRDIFYNQNIYAEKSTDIETQIVNYGFENSLVKVSLFEENKLIQSKDIVLSPTAINKVKFDYTPSESGDKKMRISVSALPGETNTLNNSKTFYLKVLRNKIKLTVISGSPSADLSAIVSSLSSDKNIDIKKIVEISKNKFLNGFEYTWIDSADVLFLIDFPGENSSAELMNRTFSSIQNNKPYFILITPTTDLSKLKRVEQQLPFSINKISSDNILVQAELVTENFNAIFSSLSAQQNIWSGLPPIAKNNSELFPKPESITLIKSSVKNIPLNSPLLISRSIGRQRSISLLSGEIWKWQLASADKSPIFFTNFINDIVKWLNLSDSKKQFTVRTTKKLFSNGENVEFITELYDQTFIPITDADVVITINNGSTNIEQKLEKVKDGLYSGIWENGFEGDYSFHAIAKFDGVSLKSETERFSVVPGSIEKYDTRMNVDFLKRLAHVSGGNFFFIDDYESLFNELNRINLNRVITTYSYNEFQLWSNSWTIAIIIILFAIEWFIRKRAGML